MYQYPAFVEKNFKTWDVAAGRMYFCHADTIVRDTASIFCFKIFVNYLPSLLEEDVKKSKSTFFVSYMARPKEMINPSVIFLNMYCCYCVRNNYVGDLHCACQPRAL